MLNPRLRSILGRAMHAGHACTLSLQQCMHRLQKNESKAAEAPAAMPDPDAAESSEAPELPGGKSGEAIEAAAARWNGYDISEIPESFLPPPEAKSKHSYTLRLDDEQICLDILIRNRAIWVKKPEGCKGQYSFRVRFHFVLPC